MQLLTTKKMLFLVNMSARDYLRQQWSTHPAMDAVRQALEIYSGGDSSHFFSASFDAGDAVGTADDADVGISTVATSAAAPGTATGSVTATASASVTASATGRSGKHASGSAKGVGIRGLKSMGGSASSALSVASDRGGSENTEVFPVSLQLEDSIREIARVEGPAGVQEYFAANPTHSSAVPTIIAEVHRALGVIHFYTTNEREVKCWCLKQGKTILESAAVVDVNISR